MLYRDEERSLVRNMIRIFGTFAKPGELSQRCLKRRNPTDDDTNDDEGPAECSICFGCHEPPQEESYHPQCLSEVRC